MSHEAVVMFSASSFAFFRPASVALGVLKGKTVVYKLVVARLGQKVVKITFDGVLDLQQVSKM